MKLWHLDSPFRLTANSATYVNVKEAELIYVRLGVYHGTEALGQVRQTTPVSPNAPRWDQTLEFEDLFNLDLPRAAKLCASICAVVRGRGGRGTRGRAASSAAAQQAAGPSTSSTANQSSVASVGGPGEEHTMLCWGNMSLFDWRGRLAQGRVSINLWSVPRDMDDLLNPLG